jgi:uncharacterized membrane protein YphA (DoxX/SURF4 family)
VKPSCDLIMPILRAGVGLYFAIAGFEKLISPVENFQLIIQSYEIASDHVSLVVAYTLPWIELLFGVFLIAGLWIRPTLIVLGGLNVLFLFSLGYALLRQIPLEDCGCFGDLLHLSPSTVLFLDSGVLIAMGLLFLSIAKSRRFGLDEWSHG